MTESNTQIELFVFVGLLCVVAFICLFSFLMPLSTVLQLLDMHSRQHTHPGLLTDLQILTSYNHPHSHTLEKDCIEKIVCVLLNLIIACLMKLIILV